MEVYIPTMEMSTRADEPAPVFAKVSPNLLSAAKVAMRRDKRTMREVIEWALRVYLAKYDHEAADALGILAAPR